MDDCKQRRCPRRLLLLLLLLCHLLFFFFFFFSSSPSSNSTINASRESAGAIRKDIDRTKQNQRHCLLTLQFLPAHLTLVFFFLSKKNFHSDLGFFFFFFFFSARDMSSGRIVGRLRQGIARAMQREGTALEASAAAVFASADAGAGRVAERAEMVALHAECLAEYQVRAAGYIGVPLPTLWLLL
jgi:hypothetical protein